MRANSLVFLALALASPGAMANRDATPPRSPSREAVSAYRNEIDGVLHELGSGRAKRTVRGFFRDRKDWEPGFTRRVSEIFRSPLNPRGQRDVDATLGYAARSGRYELVLTKLREDLLLRMDE